MIEGATEGAGGGTAASDLEPTSSPMSNSRDAMFR